MNKQTNEYCAGRLEKLFTKSAPISPDPIAATAAVMIAGVLVHPDTLPPELCRRFMQARRAVDVAKSALERELADVELKDCMIDVKLAVGPGLLLRAAPRHHVGG